MTAWPHLRAHLLVLLLLCALLPAFTAYARYQEDQYVEAFGPLTCKEKNNGVALQQAALRRGDLLPLFGLCDLPYRELFHVCAVFRDRPTGFNVFPVMRIGPTTAVNILEDIAALDGLRGRKIIVVTNHTMYAQAPFTNMEALLASGRPRQRLYDSYYARLPAYELAFSTRLAYDIKVGAAQRMLCYPDRLQGDPLLLLALRKLAHGTRSDRICYSVLLPIGKLATYLMELRDHWDVLCFIRRHRFRMRPAAGAGTIDWSAYTERAMQYCRESTGNNPFGIKAIWWERQYQSNWKPLPAASYDERYQQMLSQADEMVDLRLLLTALRQVGARPLLVSGPLKGKYCDAVGVSAQARAQWYRSVMAVAREFSVPCVNFSDMDEDLYFVSDEGHYSARGWLYFDRVLDQYYHQPL